MKIFVRNFGVALAAAIVASSVLTQGAVALEPTVINGTAAGPLSNSVAYI